MARIGVGRRVGSGFVWTSARVPGVLAGLVVTFLSIVGFIGIIALIIGIVSR